jgi:hypothetical protein
MTDKLAAPSRKRFLNPPAADIPKDGKIAKLADKKGGWSFEGKAGETVAEAMACLCLDPAMSAAPTIRQITGNTNIELHGLVNELQAQVQAVNAGDMSRAEGMLVAQAHTLDGIFHALTMRAKSNMGEYLETMELYLRLALKAQTQCRATLETLGQLKNPGNVAFVKQANIAHGPQQVNNGESPARAGETQIPPTKVLEDQRGKWLDAGTQEAAGRLNQALAAVGKVHRPQIAGGESEGQPQRVQGRDSAAIAGNGASAEGSEGSSGRVLRLPKSVA